MSDRHDQPGDAHDDRQDDLRSTSDSIRKHARDLASIEREKASLPADDPRVDELSKAAVETADTIARETRAERQLTDLA